MQTRQSIWEVFGVHLYLTWWLRVLATCVLYACYQISCCVDYSLELLLAITTRALPKNRPESVTKYSWSIIIIFGQHEGKVKGKAPALSPNNPFVSVTKEQHVSKILWFLSNTKMQQKCYCFCPIWGQSRRESLSAAHSQVRPKCLGFTYFTLIIYRTI